MVMLRDVMDALGEMYPWELAGPSDGSGVLVGSPDSDIRGVLCAVDPLSAALKAALDGGLELLVVHHPHLLMGARSLDAGALGGELVRMSVREGLNIVACHLNADYAEGGLADLYAAKLGMLEPRPLVPATGAYYAKVVVFVPGGALEAVSSAMALTGAGVLGDYTHCGFRTPGTGTFIPAEGTHPYAGEAGRLNREAETRLEMIAPSFKVAGVLRAIKAAHPYEEVACDVYRTENPVPWGLGRFGVLSRPRSPLEIMEELSRWCGSATGVLEGEEDLHVTRVAVVPGRGDDAVFPALEAGAQLLVTGELSWHRRLEAMETGAAVIMLGHAESEGPFVPATIEGLRRASGKWRWGLEIEGFDRSGKERRGA